MATFKTEKKYIELLTKADEEYYSIGASSLSDEYYDSIRDELFELYPNSKYKASVGFQSSSDKKIKHEIKMGSQKKIKTPEEMATFINNVESKVQKPTFFGSEKMDGFSLSLTFKNGEMVLGASRGDGEYGEDLTENVKKIVNYPKHIKNKLNVKVRGEGILAKEVFKKINDANEFDEKLSNPRNAVAGMIRRSDGKDCEKISFLAYDIEFEGSNLDEDKKFALLRKMGFETPEFIPLKTKEEIQNYWQEYEDGKRDACNYELDGLIISVNDYEQQQELGIIDNRPRYSRAYKFTPQRVQTIVENITWQAGRTGRITPVANVKPVHVAGVIVSNVTLHNLSEVIKKHVSLNAVIEIQRAGDVIPKLERVLVRGDDDLKIPAHCPSCKKPTVQEETFLMCHNKECPAKHYENLLHWVTTLEVKGFAEKIVFKLYELGLLAKITDFYKLTPELVCKADRMAEKSAKKILNELNSKREISFPMFIRGLGILNFSDKTAEMLEDQYDIHTIMKATKKDLLNIHGIGEIVANAILTIREREKEINEILQYVKIKEKEKPSSSKLVNINVCFTGVRSKELEQLIIANGGKIISSVSKNLTYLVAKDPTDNSEKLNKARSLDIKIVTLEEMQKIAGQ